MKLKFNKHQKNHLKIALTLLSAVSVLASCTTESTNETNNPESLSNLNKRIILQKQSAFPASDTKEVQYYSNSQIVADTVFDSSNQWIQRKLVFFNGTTKVFQTLDTSGQIIAHREETYDSQGRVTGRRTYVPSNNIIAVAFTYNPDNTVTANAVNLMDQTVTPISTYHKNSTGLIYKKFEQQSPTFGTAMVESTILFNNSQPVSLVNSLNSSVISFDYYPNQKPSNLLKSADQINNITLLGLSLMKIAEEGNFYYKRTDENNGTIATTYQTDFNAYNYIEYFKSTYVTLPATSNMLSTEIFYYYN